MSQIVNQQANRANPLAQGYSIGGPRSESGPFKYCNWTSSSRKVTVSGATDCKKTHAPFTKFVDLFSIIFKQNIKNFSSLWRNCTFSALINGTLKGLTNNMISMKNRKKYIFQRSRSVIHACLVHQICLCNHTDQVW